MRTLNHVFGSGNFTNRILLIPLAAKLMKKSIKTYFILHREHNLLGRTTN
jgi:hypothetical protein